MLGVRVLDEADGEHDKKKRKKEAKDRKKDKRRSNKESSKRHEHRVEAGGEGHGGEREPQAGQEMWDRMFGDNRGNDGESAADASADPNPEPEPPAAKANHVDPTTTRTTNNTVGDGGASWRMKALKRAQTQADERGTSLRDVVSQRWGSVSELAEGAVPTARGETFAVQQPSSVRAVQAQQPIQNTTNVYVTVPNSDPSATIRTIQRWARNNGALPIMRGH